MTETAAPAQTVAEAREAKYNAYTAEYIEANRLQYNDVDEQNDGDGVGYWYVEIDMVPKATEDGASVKGCACGCGFAVRSAKRNFLPGHDQRLMGILVRAHREGMEVAWTEGGALFSSEPMGFGQQVLNEKGIAKLAGYIATEPKRARRRTSAAQAAEIIDAPALPKYTKVKVGRWEYPILDLSYDGDKIVAVRYQNARKEEVVTYTWGKLS